MSHPFLENTYHIPWHRLKPECIQADIELALQQTQVRLDVIADTPHHEVTLENSLLDLEAATEDLGRAWGYVSHLDSVNNSAALREAYNAMLPKVSEFYTRIHLNDKLWGVIKAFAESKEGKSLTGIHKRLLEETLADFRECGADLPAEKKKQLEQLNTELTRQTQKYSENVLDSTNAWDLLITDESRLAGLPESARDARAHAPARHSSSELSTTSFPRAEGRISI